MGGWGACPRPHGDPLPSLGGHSCERRGLPIRFPFRLKDKEPPHCGYPGFDLSCNHNDTLFEISAVPFPIKFRVTHIYYEHRAFQVSDPENCLPRQFLKLNLTSTSPFQFINRQLQSFYYYEYDTITFFDCSPDEQYQFSCPNIYVAAGSDYLISSDLVSCTKMLDIFPAFFEPESLMTNDLTLWWTKPNCSVCETNSKLCKLKKNGTEGAVECFGEISDPKPFKKILLCTAGEIFKHTLLSFSFIILKILMLGQVRVSKKKIMFHV